MIRINMRRMTTCNQCECPCPVPQNAHQNGDETDQSVLCRVCESRLRLMAIDRLTARRNAQRDADSGQESTWWRP